MTEVKASYTEEEIQNLPAVLTSKQVADILGVTRKYVQTMASNGDIPSVKIGSAWRFSKAKVLEMVQL